MLSNTSKRSFTEGPLFVRMLLFAIPIILTGVLQLAYNMADNIVVGRFSDDTGALAAVGSVGTFNTLIVNFLCGLTAGVGVTVAQLFGAGESRRLSRTVHTAVLFSSVSGIVLGAIAFAVCRSVLTLMGTKPEILDSAVLYFRIICIGVPATALYNCGASVLRAVGDSRTPLIILAGSGIVNVILNLVLVIGFKMSVVGVAVATVVSQYISVIAVMAVLMRHKDKPYGFSLKSLCFDLPLLGRVLRLGVPAAIQSAVICFSNVLMTSAVNTFPTTTVSANTIAGNVDGIAYTTMNSFSQTALTFAGQNWGAAKPKRIRRVYLYSLIQVSIIGFIVGRLLLIFCEPVASLYINPTDENYAAIMAAAKEIMNLILSTYFICGIMEVLAGFMRGIGYAIAPMIIGITSMCGIRVLWIYTVFPLEGMQTITGLYTSYPVTWSVSVLCYAVLSVFAFKKIRDIERLLDKKAAEAAG